MSQPELARTHEDRLVIHNLVKRDPLADFAEDVRRGLSAKRSISFPNIFTTSWARNCSRLSACCLSTI